MSGRTCLRQTYDSVVRHVLIASVLTLISAAPASSQVAWSSSAETVTAYSQNGRFYLRSVPFDHGSPHLHGITRVFQVDGDRLVYSFDKAIEASVDEGPTVILSNDGEVIFAVNVSFPDPGAPDRSVSIFRRGTLIRSFTKEEITGCPRLERCFSLYYNEKVIDKDKSHFGTKDFKKVVKSGTSDKERFLAEYAIFSAGDSVYLTNSKKATHTFSLLSGERTRSVAFDSAYPELKTLAQRNRTELESFPTPGTDLPRLKDGRSAYAALAASMDMKVLDVIGPEDREFAGHWFRFGGMLFRDGHFEPDLVKVESPRLSKERITDFLKAQTFDTSAIPAVADRWYFGGLYLDGDLVSLRDADDRVARAEKQQADQERERFLAANATAESIGGVYNPKDLVDCFAELDKKLPPDLREEMRRLRNAGEMARYHFPLGMQLRNDWGLWMNSRLANYFNARGVNEPDDMSGIIFRYYYDWVNGRKDAWKKWDKKASSSVDRTILMPLTSAH